MRLVLGRPATPAGGVAMNVVSLTRRVTGIGRLLFFDWAFSSLGRLIGLETDGVADVDAHDQMRAALQVEAAADRLRGDLGRNDGGDEDRRGQRGSDTTFHNRLLFKISSRKKAKRLLRRIAGDDSGDR